MPSTVTTFKASHFTREFRQLSQLENCFLLRVVMPAILQKTRLPNATTVERSQFMKSMMLGSENLHS